MRNKTMSKGEFARVQHEIRLDNPDTFNACAKKKFFRLESHAYIELRRGLKKKYLKPSAYVYKCPHCVGYHVTNGVTMKNTVPVAKNESAPFGVDEFVLATLYKLDNVAIKNLVNAYQVVSGELKNARNDQNDEIIRLKQSCIDLEYVLNEEKRDHAQTFSQHSLLLADHSVMRDSFNQQIATLELQRFALCFVVVLMILAFMMKCAH